MKERNKERKKEKEIKNRKKSEKEIEKRKKFDVGGFHRIYQM